MMANLETILVEAGVTDALYAIQVDKDAKKAKFMEAVREATLNALFDAGGVVALE